MSKPFALIVEDHVDAAVIFTEALKKTGYETDTVRTGDAALARCKSEVPELRRCALIVLARILTSAMYFTTDPNPLDSGTASTPRP